MAYYINNCDGGASAPTDKKIAVDDLFLTTDMPTTAGSMMLEGYMSLFAADAVNRASAAGFVVAGKANVGEFGVDVLGETSYFGGCTDDKGALVQAASALIADGTVGSALVFDINGAPRRGAAQAGQVCIKPTYGTVSRFGTIAIACSGETVSVTAADVASVRELLDAIVGHDDKDGTSLPAEQCDLVKSAAAGAATAACSAAACAAARKDIKTVGIAASLVASADDDVKAAIALAKNKLEAAGIALVEIDDAVLKTARVAWNICLAAELCNNVSRFDGVKYGHRTSDYATIDELYTNSRTEAFGELAKTFILFGSETLSTDNYERMYDKSLRIRRVVVERFAELFGSCDAILMPACSQMAYNAQEIAADTYRVFTENVYTAPATLAGLPAVVAAGVQLVGPAFSDQALLDVCELLSKEA